MRRFSLAAVAVVVLGLLTACTAKPRALAAILVRDGHPAVVLVTCVGSFSQLGIFVNHPKGSPAPADDALVTWGVNGYARTEIVEVAAFAPPPEGWYKDTVDPTTSPTTGPAITPTNGPAIDPSTNFDGRTAQARDRQETNRPPWRPPPETLSFRTELLRELKPGVDYDVDGSSGNIQGYPVDFTTADLDHLQDGHVLTTENDGGTTTMEYDAYIRQARGARGDCPHD